MLEEIVPLEAAHFFAFEVACHYAKGKKLEKEHKLPDLGPFYQERSFAQVSLGWHELGICVEVKIKGRFDQPDFPNYQSADSIELFFDTRDVKTAGYPSRFCHHFYFLPQSIQTNGDSIQAGEVTRFRLDDAHALCDASLLQVKSKEQKSESLIEVWIPAECLHGYDPKQFNRLGFTYRINRVDGSVQYFSASSKDFSIESQPSLWASVLLKTGV